MAEHGPALLIAGALTAVASLIIWFALAAPTAPRKPKEGTVLALHVGESDAGSYAVAVVRLPDRTATVRLPRPSNCHVGDHIRRAPHGWICTRG